MIPPAARCCVIGVLLLAACADLPDTAEAPATEAAAFGDNALPACGTETRPWVTYQQGVCPAAKSCQVIDQPGTEPLSFVLPRTCTYDRVEFQITRSNVTLDCAGATLAGGNTGDGSIALSVVDAQRVGLGGEFASWQEVPADNCSREREPVQNVTIRNCTVTGYDGGALVRLYPRGAETLETVMRERYLAWFHHTNEREHRMTLIDDCMRNAAPRDVTFDNVHLRGPKGNGLHVFTWVHGVTFRNGSITGAQGGTGVYLSPGSQNNLIANNTISDNYREGVAIDGSAFNRIIDNTMVANGLNWWYGLSAWDFTGKTDFYFVGITVFKNAWEKPTTTGPRTQHASDNEIAIVKGTTTLSMTLAGPKATDAAVIKAFADKVFGHI